MISLLIYFELRGLNYLALNARYKNKKEKGLAIKLLFSIINDGVNGYT